MLCASISRWKFQRSSIGKLPKSACCLIIDCSATSAMLPASTPASSSRRSPSCVHSAAGGTVESQSTMLPIMLNSSASNAPMTAVSTAVASRYGSQALRARPQEREEAARRRGWRRVRVGVDQALEIAEHAGSPTSGEARHPARTDGPRGRRRQRGVRDRRRLAVRMVASALRARVHPAARPRPLECRGMLDFPRLRRTDRYPT